MGCCTADTCKFCGHTAVIYTQNTIQPNNIILCCHAITSLIGIFIIPSQYLKYESCLDTLQITLFLNM